MNEPHRLRYANQIVGAFLLVVLLIAMFLAVLLLRTGDYFVQHDHYWIEINQSELDGLRRGIEVTMLGQRVGEIESVQYVDDTNRVRVNLIIDSKHSDQIFETSILVPDRKFGLGTPVLAIQRGEIPGQTPKPLPPGSRIDAYQNQTDRVDQMARGVDSVSDSVRKIQQKLDPTMTSVDDAANDFSSSIANSMNPAFDRVETASKSFTKTNEVLRPDAIATLEAVRSATTDLQQRVGTLTDKIQLLVERDVQKTLADVQQSSNDVSKAAAQVGRTAEDANQEIADALSTVQRAAESVQKLAEETRDVVRIVRSEADDLPGTTARVNDTVHDTQDLVEEIRGHWLLQRTSRRGMPTAPISPAGIRAGVGR
jgi:ABC-type transporter Mla subunit MlaD